MIIVLRGKHKPSYTTVYLKNYSMLVQIVHRGECTERVVGLIILLGYTNLFTLYALSIKADRRSLRDIQYRNRCFSINITTHTFQVFKSQWTVSQQETQKQEQHLPDAAY